ncbi:MAG TPA: hypothetical protein PK588_09965, partial [Paludibacteraceae bacterium]|nr:hypothetical protein [Paludibacteraceae bacterium]
MLNKETYKHVNLFLKLISNLTNPQGSPLDPFYKQLSNERFYNYRTKKRAAISAALSNIFMSRPEIALQQKSNEYER